VKKLWILVPVSLVLGIYFTADYLVKDYREFHAMQAEDPYWTMTKMNITNVAEKQEIDISIDHIPSTLILHISSDLNGAAQVRIEAIDNLGQSYAHMAADLESGPQVINQRMDWYEQRTTLYYKPIDATSGKLDIRYSID